VSEVDGLWTSWWSKVLDVGRGERTMNNQMARMV